MLLSMLAMAFTPLAWLAVSLLGWLAQQPPEVVPFLDMIDLFVRMTSLALLVIPVAEVRKLLGGLPDLTLPWKNPDGSPKYVIRAGRWFSALVTAVLLGFGHTVGWLGFPESVGSIEAWFALEWAVAQVIANTVYTKWWKEQLGLNGGAAGKGLMRS